jgi:hypothetical protein
MFDGRAALGYYLSPFDALIDVSRALLCAMRTQTFSVRPVDAFRPQAVEAPDGSPLIASLHVAWRARSGRVLVRPDGRPNSLLCSNEEMESGRTVLEPPPGAVCLIEAIHERAGLFAWRETMQTYDAWDRRTLALLARQAWQRTPGEEVDDPLPDFDQCAVYDPEGQQWHFVSALEVMKRCADL